MVSMFLLLKAPLCNLVTLVLWFPLLSEGMEIPHINGISSEGYCEFIFCRSSAVHRSSNLSGPLSAFTVPYSTGEPGIQSGETRVQVTSFTAKQWGGMSITLILQLFKHYKQVWHLPLSLSLGWKICFRKTIPALSPGLCWETYQCGQA